MTTMPLLRMAFDREQSIGQAPKYTMKSLQSAIGKGNQQGELARGARGDYAVKAG